MYISNLKIWNFRKFGLKQDTVIKDDNSGIDIDLSSGLNVLVGENDSGKTAIIDAIRYTLDTNSSERFYLSEDDFHNNETSLRIAITFKFDEDEDPSEKCGSFTEHLSYEEANKPILYVTLQADITERVFRGNKFIDKSIRTGLNGTGNLLDGEIKEFIKTTYLKPLRDAENELSSGRGSRLSQILFSHKDITNSRDTLISHMLDANRAISGERVITDTQNKINNDYFKKMLFTNDDLLANINFSDYSSLESLSEPQKDFLLKKILEKLNLNLHINDQTFQTPHGLGYNNLMFIATELLLLEQEKESNLSLLLVEEPEAHLHPQMQLLLLEFIKEAKNIQVILSSHSPTLASKVPIEKIHIVTNGSAFSLDKPLTKLEDDDYKFLEKFLDVTKSNLFFARGVIIVEGDAENILLPTIAKLLNCSFEDYGISVVNVGHTGLSRFSKIFQRNDERSEFIPVKIACITDRDLRPECVKYNTEDEDGNKDIPDGYIKWSSRNNKTFENYWDGSDGKKLNEDFLSKKTVNDGQHVNTFISDKWTLEYDLAYSGLPKEVYEAINGSTDDYSFNLEDKEKSCAKIYKPLVTQSNKSKTETAYQLGLILTAKYWNEENNEPKDTQDLISKLPIYLIDAFEFVTGKVIRQRITTGDENGGN